MRKSAVVALALGLVPIASTGEAEGAVGCFSECRQERTEVICRSQTTDGEAPRFWYWSNGAGV